MRTNKYNEDDNTLAMYLKEINRIPLLSHEDEEKYAVLAAKGDKEARKILIESNLRFVVNVAKKFQNKGLPFADLINEGNIGLINAIEKYDVNRGYHFISYAVWWIRQAILKAIGEKSKMIRLPLNRFGELVQIEKARKVMYESLGREPDAKEIADHLHMDRKDVAELLSISREYVSLDTPLKPGTRDASLLGDFIEDKSVKQPEEEIVNESLKVEVSKLLDKLPEKEAAIIKERYGLGGEKPKSLKEIGDLFHLTKERIRQIEKRALLRLKSMPMTQELEAYAC
ncbi:MAG: RNA polymerase sigma factor RpoD/SigA [Spirochaetia bacterium]|nr:RNA polymerase sigma factor RpoD/SigA [Spirochaetia bacterium]MBQ3713682.1 RNA polymerase sigma factor RpoD/SigA [Spirochaetia bacterium]MBQ6673784.1 RNA polymerase sigma factor RpoD/SigA [Spirochaetia bacterium]